MNKKIVFNKPFYTDMETHNLNNCVLNGHDFSVDVVEQLQNITGAKNILLTGSATSAMEAYLASCNFTEGSEVIIPSFTYPAAANAVIAAGLIPVFADIRPDTLVMDLKDTINKITKNTSCIMPVHYGGASVDLEALIELSHSKNISIFEDAALSIGALYKGKHLGTIGEAGVISFHKTKNLSGEGGGALIVRDLSKYNILEEVIDSGTDRKAFFRKEKSAYSWQRPGRGVNPVSLSLAVLSAQLSKIDIIQNRRQKIWNNYFNCLSYLEQKNKLVLPKISEFNVNNHHVFYILLKDNETREHLRTQLLDNKIEAVIHYMPLHSSDYGKSLGYKNDDCPVSQSVSGRLLRLPLHMGISDNDVEFICENIRRSLDR